MTQPRWSRIPPRLLRLVALERGAVLWVPAVILSGAFLILGMRLASFESTGSTQSHELLVVLGPMQGISDEPGVTDEFRSCFRSGLERQPEFALVSEEILRRRMKAPLGSPLPEDTLTWIRATRNLKVRFYLAVRLVRLPDGELQAKLEVWEASQEHAVDQLQVQARNASALGQLLADSLTVSLFEPQFPRSARR